MLTSAPASGPRSALVITEPLRRPSPARTTRRPGGARVSARGAASPVTTVCADPRYSSRRRNPSAGTVTSIRPVLSAPRLAVSAIVPGLGTLQMANQPLSPVLATRRGLRWTTPSGLKENSNHSPVTVTPAAGARSRASRMMPTTTAPGSAPEGSPQIAARSRAGEGTPKSARTGRWPSMYTSRNGGSMPSESSIG